MKLPIFALSLTATLLMGNAQAAPKQNVSRADANSATTKFLEQVLASIKLVTLTPNIDDAAFIFGKNPTTGEKETEFNLVKANVKATLIFDRDWTVDIPSKDPSSKSAKYDKLIPKAYIAAKDMMFSAVGTKDPDVATIHAEFRGVSTKPNDPAAVRPLVIRVGNEVNQNLYQTRLFSLDATIHMKPNSFSIQSVSGTCKSDQKIVGDDGISHTVLNNCSFKGAWDDKNQFVLHATYSEPK